MRLSAKGKWFVLRAVIVGEVAAFLASFRVWHKMNTDQGMYSTMLYTIHVVLALWLDTNEFSFHFFYDTSIQTIENGCTTSIHQY